MTVTLADGVYYLPETLTFAPEDSGSKEHPVVYRAKNRGKAVISGGLKLELDWRPDQDGIFQATTPAGLDICLLYTSPSPRDLSTSRMPSSA